MIQTVPRGFPGGAVVNSLPASAVDTEDAGSIPGLEDPLKKETATHSSILPWRIPWTEEWGGYRPWDHKASGRTEWPSAVRSQAMIELYYLLLEITIQAFVYLFIIANGWKTVHLRNILSSSVACYHHLTLLHLSLTSNYVARDEIWSFVIGGLVIIEVTFQHIF